MAGLVGIIANEAGRFSLFPACMYKLIEYNAKRQLDAEIHTLMGGDWCGARNDLVRMVLKGGGEWLWFMDDDHAFTPSMLETLLAHNLPLVTPVCLTRVYPFKCVQYTAKVGPNQYLPIPFGETATSGLIEIEAGGCAGMLIRREVLEAIEPPWFEYADRSEDIIFCEKAKAAGFKLHADLSCRLGHITTTVVSPEVQDGRWATLLHVGGGLNVFVQTAEEFMEEEQTFPVQ